MTAPDASLVAAKLRALVRDGEGVEPAGVDARLAPGSAAVAAGERTWVLLEHDPLGGLGPALLWLERSGRWRGATVVAGRDELEVVRLRLAAFADPPAVAGVEGRELRPVEVPTLDEALEAAGEARRADPDALLAGVDAAARRAAVELLDEAIRRHPDLAVEPAGDALVLSLDGLEVARLVAGEEPEFEVGVGEHDQDARRRVVGHRVVGADSLEVDLADLAHAVEVVARHRGGAAPHPLRRLGTSRRLRARVIDDPSLAGLGADADLEAVADPVPAAGLRDERPGVAVGAGAVVVCSVGIDLDAVPTAGHAWLQACGSADAPARVTLVVPERDAHPATRELLARLRPEANARLVTVRGDWEAR